MVATEPVLDPSDRLHPRVNMVGVVTHAPGRILTLPGAFTTEECAALIAEAEDAGFKPSAKSGGGHGQVATTGARTSQFRVVDNQKLANLLWDRVKTAVPADLHGIKPVPYMPNQATRGDEYSAVGCNPHLRFYKYDPGQFVLSTTTIACRASGLTRRRASTMSR